MLYQLPNGKVIKISFEDFLAMTDDDIQFCISKNYGEVVHSPWFDSQLVKGKKEKQTENEEDNTIDFEPELDEPDHFKNQDDETGDLSIIDIPDLE